MATRQFDLKNPINIPTQTNNNFTMWEFVPTLPDYYCLNSESVAKRELMYFKKYGVFLADSFKSSFGLDYNAKSLLAFKDFASCVRKGKATSIIASVNAKIKTTPYNEKKFADFLTQSIEEVITISIIDSRDSEVLVSVRQLFFNFFAYYETFSKNVFDETKKYNKYIFENTKLAKKSLYEYYHSQNQSIYNQLPNNIGYFDYLRNIGVSNKAIDDAVNDNSFADDAGNESDTNNKKTTTNNNISPILIGAVILVAVIIFKKMKK